MASEKQIAANRANAKRSTGPKTKKGRYASSRNALRHGLASPAQLNESISLNIETLAQTLLHEGSSEDQVAAARRLAQVQLDLSRVRMVRATLIASLDLVHCKADELRYLMVIDRYERIARAKRRTAADRL
jgi:hypothetical protein